MSNTVQIDDQMFEDIAGEELSEYNEDFGLDAEFSKYSEIDEFADIDYYH